MRETGRVLVTGATGFIGRTLLDALSRASTPVTAATRGASPLLGDTRAYRITDLGPTTDWRGAFEECGTVVHLAARVHMMREDATDPLSEFRRVNVAGTLRLAQQAARAGVGRFVYLSSIKVNGESTKAGTSFTETDLPAPKDPYGVSKAEAEASLMALAAETGMEVVVIRPPLVYGPGVRANFLAMTRWLARGVPLPLGSITENRRTLVGVDNLVDLILTCLRHPAAANQVFMAGDDEALSTAELLRRTAAALGRPARLVPVPPQLLAIGATVVGRRDMMQRLCGSLQVDTTKARHALGWTPPFSVDEGLRRAVRGLQV